MSFGPETFNAVQPRKTPKPSNHSDFMSSRVSGPPVLKLMEAIGSKVESGMFGKLDVKYGAAVAAAAGTALSRMSRDATAHSTGTAFNVRSIRSFENVGKLQGWDPSSEGQKRIHGFKIRPIFMVKSDLWPNQPRQ